MASLNLMPDSDMDSVAHTMEGSGLFDPTVLATTPKKRKRRKKRNLIREGRVSRTLGQTHHQITVNQVLPLKKHPFIHYFLKKATMMLTQVQIKLL